MTCRHVRKTLANSAPVELSPEALSQIKHHAESCAKCAALLAKAQRLDAALALMLGLAAEESLDRQAATQSRPARSAASSQWKRRLRWPIYVGATSLTMVVGLAVGGFAMLALLPKTEAGALDDLIGHEGFLNESYIPGASFHDTFEDGLANWQPKKQIEFNFGGVDDQVAHTGKRSIKLLQRPFGAYFSKHFAVPVPKGAIIRYGCWALSPRGGTPTNKWLNLAIFLDSGGGVGSDVLGANAQWQPQALEFNTNKASDGFTVHFTTGSGDGKYLGYDWATWVDDVRVYIHSPVHLSSWRLEGDRLHVYAMLPKPYSPSDVRLSEVYLRSIFREIGPMPAASAESLGDVLHFTFESKGLARYILTATDEYGDPKPLDVVFAAKKGELACIFGASVRRDAPVQSFEN